MRITVPAAAVRATQTVARWVARVVSRLCGVEIVVGYGSRDRTVALTFDDGPDPVTTPGLLAVLAAHRARGTFFVVGERGHRHPALLAAIVGAGHELGNHLGRDEPSVLLGRAEFDRQLAGVHELLTRYGPVRFWRPGSGWFTPSMLRSAAELDYRCALGSAGLIASRYPSPEALAARLARRCRPGAVIVLHEGPTGRDGVVPVVDQLLRELGRRGLSAVTLSELAGGPVAARPAQAVIRARPRVRGWRGGRERR
jgi:peptidoglycan-N-acetylglucosamine deacetylase